MAIRLTGCATVWPPRRVLKDRLAEFQLVLLDWGLPHKSGIEVLRALRAGGNNIPVLILTARDALADRVEGLDRGADDFLVKPFELAELKARMRALLRRHAGRVGAAAADGEPGAGPGIAQRRPRRAADTAHRARIRAAAGPHAAPRDAALTCAARGAHLRLVQRPWRAMPVEFLLHSLRRKIGTDQIENLRGLGWRISVTSEVTAPAAAGGAVDRSLGGRRAVGGRCLPAGEPPGQGPAG